MTLKTDLERLVRRSLAGFAMLVCAILTCHGGTPTENHGIRALPTPGAMLIDGKVEDWDLSGGLFLCGDAEKNRETYSAWIHVMYDRENLYLLARVKDAHPMANQGIVGSSHGFANDCLQFRFITNYETPDEKVAHFTAWQGKGGADAIEVTYGRDFKEGRLRDAQEEGAAMELRLDADDLGYTQEIKLPMALIAKSPTAFGPETAAVITFELFFAGGNSAKDNFRPGVTPDRVFTFRAYDNWGALTFAEAGKVEPHKVRLADGREFAVAMEDGVPQVDWTGLETDALEGGFLPISLEMPFAGVASVHIRDASGRVVRHLLNAETLSKGSHRFLWDGLATPDFTRPGEELPAGTYTWHGIAHPGLDLEMRGWAGNSGSVPWDSGKTANWGGDHGMPSDCDTQGEVMILGWTGAEAGKPAVLTDLDGKVKWRHIRGGMGGAECVAIDGERVYVLDHGRIIYGLALATGEPVPWAGSANYDLAVSTLWGELPNMPTQVSGLEAHAGKLYVSLVDIGLPEIADVDALAKLMGQGEGLAGQVLTQLSERNQTGYREFAAGAENPRFKPNAGQLKAILTGIYNDRLGATSLEMVTRDGAARAIVSEMVSALPGVFGARAEGNVIAVLDADSGALLKTFAVPGPRRLRAGPDGMLYVLSEDDAVLRVDPADGSYTAVIQGLRTAKGIAVDDQGLIYVGVRELDNHVKVYRANGELSHSIGQAGGRAARGPWDPRGMRQIAGLAVDARKHVWIAEAHKIPKRFAVYEAGERGGFVREYFGPSHYGSTGAAINPRDPDLMIGEGCEWRLDPATGQASCLGVYDREIPSFARFGDGSNGRQYLATNHGRKNIVHVYERLGDGDYRLRAKIYGTVDEGAAFWSDANDDELEQPEEIQTIPYHLNVTGYVGWSMGVSSDLSIWAPTMPLPKPRFNRATEDKAEYEARLRALAEARGPVPASAHIAVQGYTACGAPLWDLAQIQAIPRTGVAPMPSLDGSFLVGYGDGKQSDQWQGIDLRTGQVMWQYPNGWHGVHGSHRAPPPTPGLIRGAFGLIGCVDWPPATGAVWAMNTNVGEWHLLTQTGFYLDSLFQGDLLEVEWPPSAVPGTIVNSVPAGAGAEDFGGTFIQGQDGKYYVQAGKIALWNLELKNLDKVQALAGGTITVTAADVETARAGQLERLQKVEGNKSLSIQKKPVSFSGDIRQDFGSEAQVLSFERKADSKVEVRTSYDDANLYVAWQVRDSSPWINGADAAAYLYARGDTVDLQLGTAPGGDESRQAAALGDLRLSIGSLGGTPTAVIYREKAADAGATPMIFSSGVIPSFPVASVSVAEDVEIVVRKGRQDYVIEARIPLATLGIESLEGKTLRGDFGATHGDSTGTDTVLRTYWNNQQTGMVSDEVFELKVEPRNWGTIRFE